MAILNQRAAAADTSRGGKTGTSAVPAALRALTEKAGIRINGDAPWDIRVLDDRLYRRVFSDGSVGFGEAYMDGWWECDRLDELFYRISKLDDGDSIDRGQKLRFVAEALRHRLFNLQSGRRAWQVGEQHYDAGNDVFEAMLDPTMTYSCAYWRDAGTLEEAQRNKLDLICRKLELRPGERLLDIGAGWGGLARHAAENYGAKVDGITVSKEQQALARQRCAELSINIELMDYRALSGRYDKVVSVGMFEHVGPKNYAAYFEVVDRVLKDDGLFLLHTIGHYVRLNQVDGWMDKYIFPNSHLPSAEQIAAAVEGRFLIEDWHNFGADYDRTLMAWWDNFRHAWPTLEGKYGKRFYRMWQYYLLSCAGYFRSRHGQLWQIVLSRRSRPGIYRSVR